MQRKNSIAYLFFLLFFHIPTLSAATMSANRTDTRSRGGGGMPAYGPRPSSFVTPRMYTLPRALAHRSYSFSSGPTATGRACAPNRVVQAVRNALATPKQTSPASGQPSTPLPQSTPAASMQTSSPAPSHTLSQPQTSTTIPSSPTTQHHEKNDGTVGATIAIPQPTMPPDTAAPSITISLNQKAPTQTDATLRSPPVPTVPSSDLSPNTQQHEKNDGIAGAIIAIQQPKTHATGALNVASSHAHKASILPDSATLIHNLGPKVTLTGQAVGTQHHERKDGASGGCTAMPQSKGAVDTVATSTISVAHQTRAKTTFKTEAKTIHENITQAMPKTQTVAEEPSTRSESESAPEHVRQAQQCVMLEKRSQSQGFVPITPSSTHESLLEKAVDQFASLAKRVDPYKELTEEDIEGIRKQLSPILKEILANKTVEEQQDFFKTLITKTIKELDEQAGNKNPDRVAVLHALRAIEGICILSVLHYAIPSWGLATINMARIMQTLSNHAYDTFMKIRDLFRHSATPSTVPESTIWAQEEKYLEVHEDAPAIKRVEEHNDEKNTETYFYWSEGSDKKYGILAEYKNPDAQHRDDNDKAHVPKLPQDMQKQSPEKMAALYAYTRRLECTSGTLRAAQAVERRRQTIEVTTDGAVLVGNSRSPNKDYDEHKQARHMSVHFGVANNADIAPILETAIETIKGAGAELAPIVVPAVALGTAIAVTHAVVKHGPAVAFKGLKTTLKDSFSGPNTSSRSYKYTKKLVDAQRDYIKNNPDARYVTRIEEFNGALVESTYLASSNEELDSLHHVNYAPVDLSTYGEAPSVGRIVKVSNQRPLIPGFDKPSAFQAEDQAKAAKLAQTKSPCGGNAIPTPPVTGCGQPKSQKKTTNPGRSTDPDRNKKQTPAGLPRAEPMPTHTGCGEKSKQNKGDGILTASASEKQSSGKTKGSNSDDKGKSASTEPNSSANHAIQWIPHTGKHIPKKHLTWKETVDSTRHGAAKYRWRDISEIEKIERNGWATGIPTNNGRPHKVKKFDVCIGASEGNETQYILVESTNNCTVIHGHPISREEFLRLTK